MHKTTLAAALAAALAASGSVNAGPIEDEIAAIKARLKALEAQVQDQNEVIREKDREIAELKKGQAAGGGGEGDAWFDKVEVGGLIEVAAGHVDTDGAADTDDIVAATVELGIAAQINDWVGAEFVLLYEEETDNLDGDQDNDFTVDTALITIADPDANWFVNAGQYTLPFGTYATNMIADPLTLDLGETADTAVEAGMGFGPATASVYLFDGDDRGFGATTKSNDWGAAIGIELAPGAVGVTGHLGYLSDLGETDGLNGYVVPGDGDIGGWIASAELTAGPFVLIGEYLAAMDGFDVSGANAEPSAFNIEAGVNFAIANLPAIFAISHQQTDDLDLLDPGFAEERNAAALTVEILDGTSIALEYRSEEAYDGTGTDVITGQLAVEF